MASEKISITVDRAALHEARRIASKLGLSLSAFFNEAVHRLVEEAGRRAAAEHVIAGFDPADHPTEAEIATLVAKWNAAPRVAKKRATPRKRSRAA